jgi:DNA-directed RNA polymerase specialized sigma24 family protein
MTKQPKTVPALDWLIDKQEHTASSETEALMMHDDNWKPRDESLWDVVDAVLDEDEKAVLELVVLGQWSFRQIATELGMSLGRAHNLKVKAFNKLAEALECKVNPPNQSGT